MVKSYEIHPSIGVARVGTSEEFFLGPEPGGAPPTSYRAAGKLKRQAVRFRVFECGGAALRTSWWRMRLHTSPPTAERVRAWELVGTPRVVAAGGQRLDPPAGPGWLAVGDAAVGYDPLSSQGVLRAIESGLAAGSALTRHHRGDEAVLVQYGHELERRLAGYLRDWAEYYGRERRWAESPFWRRRPGRP